ncbi:MAG: hypothetical protein GY782_02265 [Gammaproteobacteria bacterium]|nr:hypothetical protein [Gammaproteobacteria bacterium]
MIQSTHDSVLFNEAMRIMELTLGLFWWPPTIIMPGIGRLSLSNPW